jgi:hypothetical protein
LPLEKHVKRDRLVRVMANQQLCIELNSMKRGAKHQLPVKSGHDPPDSTVPRTGNARDDTPNVAITRQTFGFPAHASRGGRNR